MRREPASVPRSADRRGLPHTLSNRGTRTERGGRRGLPVAPCRRVVGALLLIDVPTLGGAEALAAERLASALRHGDAAARLGDSQLAIALGRGADELDARHVADRIGTALGTPDESGDPIAAHVGFALYPRDAWEAETLISSATMRAVAQRPAPARPRRQRGIGTSLPVVGSVSTSIGTPKTSLSRPASITSAGGPSKAMPPSAMPTRRPA